MRMTPLLAGMIAAMGGLAVVAPPRVALPAPEPKRHAGAREKARRLRQMQRAAEKKERNA